MGSDCGWWIIIMSFVGFVFGVVANHFGEKRNKQQDTGGKP